MWVRVATDADGVDTNAGAWIRMRSACVHGCRCRVRETCIRHPSPRMHVRGYGCGSVVADAGACGYACGHEAGACGYGCGCVSLRVPCGLRVRVATDAGALGYGNEFVFGCVCCGMLLRMRLCVARCERMCACDRHEYVPVCSCLFCALLP